MARRKQQGSRMAEFFEMSEESLRHARARFHAARTTLTDAETFGTEVHAQAASRAMAEAAEVYANALRDHAGIVVDYTAERTS